MKYFAIPECPRYSLHKEKRKKEEKINLIIFVNYKYIYIKFNFSTLLYIARVIPYSMDLKKKKKKLLLVIFTFDRYKPLLLYSLILCEIKSQTIYYCSER